jgi:hypothetical protein
MIEKKPLSLNILWYRGLQNVIYFGLTNSALVYEPKCGRKGGVAGSQPMRNSVHRSPTKLWRSNSIFNLCWDRMAWRGHNLFQILKGIVQPFGRGVESILIRSLLLNWRPGKFKNFFLMIQSHERNIKPFSAAKGFLRWLFHTKVTFRDFSYLRKVIL